MVFHRQVEQLHEATLYTSCPVKHLVSNIDRCQRLGGRMIVVIDLHVQAMLWRLWEFDDATIYCVGVCCVVGRFDVGMSVTGASG